MGMDETGGGTIAPHTAGSGERVLASPLALPIGLAVMMVTFALVVLAAQPPTPLPATAPASEFSAVRAMETLDRLQGDGSPHPIGSEGNAQVATRIHDELAAMGYAVETQTTFVCREAWAICGTVTNVMSRLPGTGEGPAVLLTAHYDSVPAGPGAGDDMAGVATILEVARILGAEPPPRNPVIFLLSDGEELALLGAEAFVEHPWADEVGVVVNLEANGTHGQSVLFQTTGPSAWLIDVFASRAPRPVASSVFDAIYAILPFNTDLTVYGEAGLPGLNFAFIEEHPRYHTPLDRAENLSPGSVQHHGDNALAAVHAFASIDLTDPPPGSGVFQEAAPGVILRWPEPWTIWLALAGVALWLGLAVMAVRQGAVRVRLLLWGLLALPLGVAGSALLGLAIGSGVQAVTGAATPWYAYPMPLRVAIWTGSVLITVLLASLLVRRAGFHGLWLGVWLWWALGSVIVAAMAPGISPMLLLPTVFAASAAAVVAVSPWQALARAWQAAALIGLIGAGWAWLGFARGSDYSALGPDLGVTLGVVLGLTASALAPLVAHAGAYGRMWRPAVAGAVLLMVIAVVVTTRVPVASETRPLRVNLLHVQDGQSDQAWWAVDDQSDAGERGVDDLLRAAGFPGETAAILPWSAGELPVAPAEPQPAGPVVEVVSDEERDGDRVVRLALRPTASENRVSVAVPVSVGVRRVEILGSAYAFDALSIQGEYGWFHCVGADCHGLEVGLSLAGDAPVTLFATERSWGLPEGGQRLMEARPAWAAPSGDGDTTLLIDRVTLGTE